MTMTFFASATYVSERTRWKTRKSNESIYFYDWILENKVHLLGKSVAKLYFEETAARAAGETAAVGRCER